MNGFENIIGYETVKSELERYCDVLKNSRKFKQLGVSIPRGLLLYGGAGLGKTTMANALIEESGLESVTIRKTQSDGEFIETIGRVFQNARAKSAAGPRIVFLDDLDKFANEDCDHLNAEEYVAVQGEIDNCAGYDVFVIATANSLINFPPSLLRAGRFDKTIKVDIPTATDSAAIIKYYLKNKSLMNDVDTTLIERLMEGHSCAELETTINEAGIFAVHSGRDQIIDEDFLNAYFSCFYGDAPVRDGIDADPFAEEKDHNPFIRDVAVHEVGHAIISEALDPGSVNAVSIVPSGNGLSGVTNTRKPRGYKFSKDLMENDIIISLGGKAAVEVVLGKYDLGSAGDAHKVNMIVNNMLPGIESIGPNRFMPPSDEGRYRRELTIETCIEEYYQKACRIIADNRMLFDAVLEELMEKKTLTYRDIARIRESMDKAA